MTDSPMARRAGAVLPPEQRGEAPPLVLGDKAVVLAGRIAIVELSGAVRVLEGVIVGVAAVADQVVHGVRHLASHVGFGRIAVSETLGTDSMIANSMMIVDERHCQAAVDRAPIATAEPLESMKTSGQT
jgi:hypothetical protein